MKKGFSLIEVIVATAILAITTTIMLTGYYQNRQNASLKQTAQDIAMTIRQAQAYGLSTRGTGAGVYPAYGVFFDVSAPALQKSFILFGDANGNNVYDSGESVKDFLIETGDIIDDVCGTEGVIVKCKNSDPNPVSVASIVFRRPNPIVELNDNVADILIRRKFSDVSIKIKSLGDQTKTIKVWTNGYIQVN